jgi:hypothetical protein
MYVRRRLPRLEPLESRDLPSISAFPNTSNGIFLLSDQLNGGLSDALVQFLSSRYVGTQKMLPRENVRYVADNPNWVLLHYRLATTSGPTPYITGGQWGSDWNSVTSHEDWFMHDPDGQRLTNSHWDWALHDIMNPDWRQYWLNSVIADMRAEGAQGVFADSFNAGIGSFWFDQSDPRFAGTNAANPAAWPNGFTWLNQLDDLINYIEAGLAATPEQFVYLPNLDALVTSWDTTDYSRLDGAFLEGFGDWGPSYLHGAPSDWTLSMNRALALSDAGKILIMQPSLVDTPNSPTGLLQRGFDLGTYLLLKGDHTYLNVMGGGSSSGAYYYPEDTLDLGPAVTPLATDVSQYLWNNVYRRDFQNGTVLVNPTNNSYTVTFGRNYRLVQFSGGGALTDASLDANGNYAGGSLSYTDVSTVTLESGSGVILLNETGLPPSLATIPDQTVPASQLSLDVPLSVTNPGGDPLTFTAVGQSLAYVLTQSTGTLTYASPWDNWGGRSEKWLQSASGQWYFILPTGELDVWDGGMGAHGTALGNVGSSYYADPTRLTNPPANQPHATFSFSGSTLTVTRDPAWDSAFVVTVTVDNGHGTDSKTFAVFVT